MTYEIVSGIALHSNSNSSACGAPNTALGELNTRYI